LKKIK
jgi:hypothetical protein